MAHPEEHHELCHLVIGAYPAAAVTYEIAQQLEAHLPLESLDQLTEVLGERGLTIDGTPVSAQQVAYVIPDFIFPIVELEDLVTKVAAAVIHGASVIVQSGRSLEVDAHARLAATIARFEHVGSEVATGYFGGGSLFGYELDTDTKRS